MDKGSRNQTSSFKYNCNTQTDHYDNHFLFRELSRYIAAGRLHCKVDKVGGIVETNRPDSKNWQYQATIKQGDILLNRVQKLSRVINI
jgi:26S proteasome regulatory subunit N7